jgi:hypothetical protein
MPPKLTVISGNGTPPTDQELVKFLEDRLADAKAGRILGVAFVAIHVDGAVGSGWTTGLNENVFAAVGAMEHIKQKFMEDRIE